MVSCSFNAQHKVPVQNIKIHEEKCKLKMTENYDELCIKNDSSIEVNLELINNISKNISQFGKHKNFFFFIRLN